MQGFAESTTTSMPPPAFFARGVSIPLLRNGGRAPSRVVLSTCLRATLASRICQPQLFFVRDVGKTKGDYAYDVQKHQRKPIENIFGAAGIASRTFPRRPKA